MKPREHTGIVILAAGASSRLGRPKQLLPFDGKTLLGHVSQEAVNSGAGTVIVVLGAHEDQIRKEIDLRSAMAVVNSNWQEGMASSIRCGIEALLHMQPEAESAVLMLCDQPYVTSALLNELIAIHKNKGNAIVASKYGDAIGAPALFHKSIFPELQQLKGDVGAKAVIHQHINEVEAVAFSKGSVDVDTAADYELLRYTIDDRPGEPL